MDLKSESIRLREFASIPPDEISRGEIMAALTSKFEGIQAVAAEVLGAWGDASSKAALKAWFLSKFDLPYGWAIRSVGVRELSPLLDPNDAEWVLDLYFGTEEGLLQHELWGLAASLPQEPACFILDRFARDSNPRVRHAALKVLVRTSWGDPRDLLQPYSTDSDPLIRRLLQAWGAA